MTESVDSLKTRIQQHPFLEGLPPEYVDLLVECASAKSFGMDEFVIRAGQPATHCYLVESGQIAITIHDPSRGHVVLQTLSDGGVLGWSWLVPPYRWCFDAHTLQPVEAIMLDGARLRQAFDQDCRLAHEILERFLAIFGDRLHAARFQLLDLYDK